MKILNLLKIVFGCTNFSPLLWCDQCCDGCSTIAGASSDVAPKVQQIEPLLTHCFCHVLNFECK